MITIEVINKHWEPGLYNLYHDDLIRDEYQRYMAFVYYQAINRALDKELYDKKFVRLSSDYLQWKFDNHLYTNTWQATGFLRFNISIKRLGKLNYHITFFNKRRPDSDLRLLKLARYLEYGTDRIPPRPLFTNVFRNISHNTSRYIEYFRAIKTYYPNVHGYIRQLYREEFTNNLERIKYLERSKF